MRVERWSARWVEQVGARGHPFFQWPPRAGQGPWARASLAPWLICHCSKDLSAGNNTSKMHLIPCRISLLPLSPCMELHLLLVQQPYRCKLLTCIYKATFLLVFFCHLGASPKVQNRLGAWFFKPTRSLQLEMWVFNNTFILWPFRPARRRWEGDSWLYTMGYIFKHLCCSCIVYMHTDRMCKQPLAHTNTPFARAKGCFVWATSACAHFARAN